MERRRAWVGGTWMAGAGAAAARREGLAAARGNDRHCGAPAGFGDATSAAAVDTVEAEKAHAMAAVVRRGGD